MSASNHATFEELVSILSQGIGTRTLYFSNHPRVHEYAREFTVLLHELLHRQNRDRFFLGFADGCLLHNGTRLVGSTILGKKTVDFLTRIHSGGILFHAGLTEREILELFDLAAELPRDVPNLVQLHDTLAQQNVPHIEFSPPYEDSNWFGQFLYEGTDHVEGDETLPAEQDMMPVYQDMFEAVQSSHAQAESDAAIDIDGVRTIGEQLIQAGHGNLTDVMRLVKYPDYDSFTVGHSVRVAMIAVLVAHRVGLPDHLLIELATAGLLHDVGKAKVPPEILYKPGRLDDEEFRVISHHPVHGAQILLENANSGPLAIGAAWGHHLRYDGGGYPEPATWGVSSKMTRLLTVCDVFEAITAVRPYKRALEPRRAYEIMLRDRAAFDPDCFSALITAMGLYPPGNTVILSNQERGMVLSAGAEIDKPIVRVTHDRDGAAIPAVEQQVTDLSAPSGTPARVVKMVDPTESREEIAATAHTAHGPCTHSHADGPGLAQVLGKRR